MAVTHVSRLVEHCIWANQTWIDVLAGMGSDHEALHHLMSHILLGERAWFQRIDGELVDRNVWTVVPPSERQRIQDGHAEAYRALLSGDLSRTVSFRRFTGERGSCPVADILTHLCTHGAHHRGQMAAHASAAGVEPPGCDFLDFVLWTDL